MTEIIYRVKSFDQLDVHELYAILKLRSEVFVVEQDCVYNDLDGKDQSSYHVMGWGVEDDLLTYTRLVPPGVSYIEYSSIGRVVNSALVRGQGAGQQLMEFSIRSILDLYPGVGIKISAQYYLLKFYNSLGFREIGDTYLEDNIIHIAMVYEL